MLKTSRIYKPLFYLVNTLVFIMLCISVLPYTTDVKTKIIAIILFLFIVLSVYANKIQMHTWINNHQIHAKKFIKTLLAIFALFVFSISSKLDYSDMIISAVIISLFFIILMIILMIMVEEKKDTNIILTSLKIFSTVLVVMNIMIYTISKDIILLENERFKAELLITKGEMQKSTYIEYKNFIDEISKAISAQEISKEIKNQPQRKEKRKFWIFIYIPSLSIILAALFCIAYLLNHLSIFEKKGQILSYVNTNKYRRKHLIKK